MNTSPFHLPVIISSALRDKEGFFANGNFRICKDLDCGIDLNSLLPQARKMKTHNSDSEY